MVRRLLRHRVARMIKHRHLKRAIAPAAAASVRRGSGECVHQLGQIRERAAIAMHAAPRPLPNLQQQERPTRAHSGGGGGLQRGWERQRQSETGRWHVERA